MLTAVVVLSASCLALLVAVVALTRTYDFYKKRYHSESKWSKRLCADLREARADLRDAESRLRKMVEASGLLEDQKVLRDA